MPKTTTESIGRSRDVPGGEAGGSAYESESEAAWGLEEDEASEGDDVQRRGAAARRAAAHLIRTHTYTWRLCHTLEANAGQ